MNNIKLSIIIPCYKVEQYLDQCVESVVAYKGDDIEIILVDDGSPDRVPQMCDDWAKKDHRIKVIHQQNGGLSVARNTGIDAAKGEYIWLIDSDDWIVPKGIERVLFVLSQHPAINIVVYPLIWAYGDSKKNWNDIKLSEPKIFQSRDYINGYRHAIGASPRNIIKKSYLDSANIRFYPNILHEDGLFGYQIYSLQDNILVQNEPVYCYRQREGSIMHSLSIKSAYSFYTIHRQLMIFMDKYLPKEKHDSFLLDSARFLGGVIGINKQLHGTDEFNRFLTETSEYRIAEAKKCMQVAPVFKKIKFYLLAYHPFAYYYYCNLFVLLKNELKTLIKKLYLSHE